MRFEIHGQIRGGKNHVNITRTGHRYPNKAWADWRDAVVVSLRSQRGPGCPFSEPCRVEVVCRAGDHRRRDVPACMDAIWHCLERAEVVTDDFLLQEVEWYTIYQPERPGASIDIVEIA